VQTDLTRIITTAQAGNGRIAYRAPAATPQTRLADELVNIAAELERRAALGRERGRRYRARRKARLQQLEEQARLRRLEKQARDWAEDSDGRYSGS
jgi:hypothetical protein